VHLSGGVGIGGVLEPLQAGPVIIEDDCFIGARSEVVEGVIVERGSVLSMGVFISATTKIVDRHTGEVMYGRVPAYSVVVPGSLPGQAAADGSPGPSLYCAVIVKRSTSAPAPRPRSTTCCAIDPMNLTLDPVALTQALIRCPSGHPGRGGARSTRWAASSRGWASAPGGCPSPSRHADVDNLYARIGDRRAQSLLRRSHRRGARSATPGPGRFDPFAGESADGWVWGRGAST
jgi:hypothetical protein